MFRRVREAGCHGDGNTIASSASDLPCCVDDGTGVQKPTRTEAAFVAGWAQLLAFLNISIYSFAKVLHNYCK